MKTLFMVMIVAVSAAFFAIADDDHIISNVLFQEKNKVSAEVKRAVKTLHLSTYKDNVDVNSIKADKSYTDYEFSWEELPKIKDWDELDSYIRQFREADKNTLDRETVIPVAAANGFLSDVTQNDMDKLVSICTSPCIDLKYVQIDDKNSDIIFIIQNYSGMNIANAYINGDTSQLSDDEMKVYDIAVEVVNQAKKEPTPLRKELFIHDYILQRVDYYNDSSQLRYINVIGALLDSKSNCQGYADTFYMLGNMLGFKVDKLYGTATNSDGKTENHVWNTIDFGDGKIYNVDVTWDDGAVSTGQSNPVYIYFNIPADILSDSHKWDDQRDITYDKLQKTIDQRYFYDTPEFQETDGEYFGVYADSVQAAMQFCAKRFAQGYYTTYIMAPFDSRYSNAEDFAQSFNGFLKNVRWSGSYSFQITEKGNYIYYTVMANG